MPNDKLQQAASKFNQTIQGVHPELVIKNPESKEEWDNAISTLKKKGINTAKVESVYGLFENSVEPSKPITPKNMVEPDLSTEEGKNQYYDTKGAGTRLIEGVDAGFNQLTGGFRVATGNIAKEATGEAPLERVSRAIDLGRIPQGKTIPEYEALLAQREKEFDDLEKRRAEKYKFIRKENQFTGNPTINTGEVAIPSPAWTETDAEIQRQAEDWDKRAGYNEKRYEIDNLRSYIDLAKKEGVSSATAKAKEAAKTKSWGDEVIAQGVKDIEVDAPKGTGLVYNVGNFLPQVAPIVASAAAAPFTGGTSLGWIPAAASGTSMAALSYSSAGQFMHEYDQYTSQNGIEPDQGMKFGGAAAYAAFEIIGEKLALDAAVKKMTSQYIKKSVVAGVPNKAMDLLQTYLEKNPTMAKKFVSAAADYADNGFSEATSEVFTSLGQDFTYNISRDEEFKKGFKEVIYDAWQSAQGGFMMAGITSPMIRASQQYLKNKGIRENGITLVEDKISGTPYQFLEANDDGSVLVTDKLGVKKKITSENIGRVQKYDAQTYQDLVAQSKEGKQVTILNPGDVIAESNEEQVSNNFGKFADQSGNLTIGTDDQGNQYFVTDIDDKTYGAVNAATGEKITIAKTSISLAGNENLGIIAANSISESVYKAGYLYGGNGKAVSIQEAIADAVSKGQTVESMAQLASNHMELAAKSIQANDMNGATENTIKANFYANLAKSLADATPKTEVVAGGTAVFNGKQHNVISVNNGIAELEEITEDGLGKSFDVPIQEIQAQSVVNPTVPEVEKPAQEPVLSEDVKPDNQVVEQVKEPVQTEPKTYDIEVGKETVKAVQQDNGTFLLDKVYSKSEIEKASKLVETLNKDYEDNGLAFEITPLPKKDPSNPFEKPTFAVVAKPVEVVAEDVAPIQEEVKPDEVKPAVKTTTPIIESAAKETPTSVVEEPAVPEVEQPINEAPKEVPTKLDDTIKQLEVIAEGDQVDKNPTEAQKEAGNYKKGHTTVQGFEVTIENPEGSKRSGTDGGGNRWETTMHNAYGYFKRTKGKDGDQVDTFLGPNPETGKIFVIDQMDSNTGMFDEHKVMLGFNSEEQAKTAYLSNYSKGWSGLGAITEMGRDEFKKWLKDGTRTKQPASFNAEAEKKATEHLNKLNETVLVPADPEVSHNNLVKQVKNYNGLTKYQRGTKANRRLFKTLSTLATNLGYDITTNTDGSVNVTKGGSKIRTIGQKKTKEEIEAHKLLTEYPQEFQDFANFIMGVDNLGYIDVDMDKKAVSQGIKNIKEGKKTVAANALLDELSAIYNLGEIHLSNNGEGATVSIKEFRNLYASEEKGAVEEQQANELFEPTEEVNFTDDYQTTIANAIAEHSITIETADEFEWLFGKSMVNDIKTYINDKGRANEVATGTAVASDVVAKETGDASNRIDAGTQEVGSVEKPRSDQAEGNKDGRDAANPEQAAEEGLTELQKSEIEAKTGELSRKIEAKRAELVAERGKLQAKKNELEGKKTTQTALFGTEKPQFAGQLFDIPADFSQGNITRALKNLKDGISIKEKELTDLVTKRDEIIANIVSNAKSQQELELTTEPEKKETTYQIPSSFTSQTISEFSNELDKGNIDVETFKKAFDVFMSSKDAIIEELTGKTKAELLSGMNAMGKYRYKNEKKDAIVRAIYDSHLMTFSFGTLSWSHGESVEDVIRRKVEKTTQEDIDKNVEEYNKRVEEYKARAAEYKKALTNPETIAEFGIFIAKNGKDALSVEQKAAYDNLITDKVLDKRSEEAEKKAEVSKVEIGDTGMSLIETKHTKTGEPIFVVTLSNRVDADTYKDLNAKAKKLGGYYSSFRGNGAIPGFTFKDKAQAENFMALKEGDVSAVSPEVKAEETKFKADKLRDAAQKMIEKANESLGRERLTNTYKRANEASRADANANEEKRIAETMINIADAIDAGNVKLLNGVKAKTHIELLEMMVRTSKNQENAAKYPNDRIKHKDDPATLETIEYLRFGYYPSIYGRAIVDLANKASRKSGFKQVAARWEKKLSRLTEYENYQVTSDREVDELSDMLNSLPENERTYSQVGNSIANHKRLKAIGIENDAMLRAVLREYIQYRGKAKEADKVKELERAIVGKNVGFDFFPTPSSVAELMVDEAGITKGMDVLEPSAGNGNIADAVKNADVIPDVIELSSELSKILEAKGYPVVGSDFMSYNEKKYDRIVMNPPFSNGADGDHVMHAYKLLKPGGRIVAIVGEGTFIRSDKKAVNFREWLDQVNGSEEKLPQGTFSDKKLLNTTQANARMVVIDKPEVSVKFRKTSPYYTNAEYALSSIEMTKATPEQWKAMLLKGGAKETELRWMNWDDFSKDKKSITKEEVQQFIDEQKVVVNEVVKSQSKTITREEALKAMDKGIEVYGIHQDGSEFLIENLDDLDRAEKLAFEEDLAPSETKYSQYTTPGGKNYKEVLLTLPNSIKLSKRKNASGYWDVITDSGEVINTAQTEEGANNYIKYDSDYQLSKSGKTFSSSHYEEPNIAAHIRLAEFITKDGKKALHVEEVQSDWAQKGKKQGFKIDTAKLEKQQEEINQHLIKKYGTEAWMNKATEEEYKEWRDIDNQIRNGLVGAPDMPFKQTDQWVGLGMKWALRYAAENGFDVVTWTTGEQQAARYDLSKQINEVEVEKGSTKKSWVYKLTFRDKNDNPFIEYANTPNELEALVGKELTNKIVSDVVEPHAYKSYSGIDLKIGGSGMKAFYDNIIPSWVNKYVKKWGAKAGTTEIDTKPELTNDGINLDSGEINQPTNGKFTTVHSVEVTPSMTISVMEGQPMFRASERVFTDVTKERHHQQISKAVNELQEKAPNALPLRVVRNNQELSEAIKDLPKSEQVRIQEAIDAKDVISGVTTSKAVFIVSENISDENEAIHTWIHEQASHVGLRLLIPDPYQRNQFYQQVFESVGESGFKALLDEIDPSGATYASYADESNASKGEEYMAFLSQKILNREQMTAQQYKFWSVIRQKLIDIINNVLTSYNKRSTFTDRELALIVKAGASKLYDDAYFEKPSRNDNQEKPRGANASDGSALRGDRGDILVVPKVQNTVSSPNLQAIHAERAYREFDPITTRKIAHDALLRSVPNSKLERLSFGHGTNVLFDKFDIKYAGTGTGEKIHGYGLYLSITANDPAVAVTYANKVAFTSAEVRKYAENISEKYGHLAFKAFEKATYDTKRGKDLLTSLKDRYAETGKPYIKSVIDHVESNPIPFSKIVYFGQMEKPDGTPFHFIEWDTEFIYKDQWDAITNGLTREGHSVDEWLERLGEEALLDDGQLNGKQVYRSLAKLLAESNSDSNGSPKNASEFLYRAGFDGTIYADKEIADGKERYNVCSFSDKPIHITETVKFRKKDKNPAEMSRLDVQVRIFADRMIAQKNVEKEILRRGGRITDASNVSMQENLSSSIASEAMKKFNKELVKPYVETIVSVMQEGNLTQEDVEKYLIAKHTPERNKTFRDLGKDGETFSGMDEKEALERVKDVEGKVSGKLISKLWEQTNAITKFALDYDLASGRISKETHDRYTGPDNEWKHYVPLKGWEAETLDDADYVDTGSGAFTPTLKKAKGRTSASDTPIHYMISAAYSSIAAGEKNKVKAAAVRLATNNPDMTDIFHLKKVWMVKSGLKDENGKDIYLETTEKPSPEQFNEGLVKTKIDTRHEVGKPRDKSKQEEVTAYIKGEKYTVIYEPKYVAAANAINKVTDKMTAKANDVIQGTIGIFTRWLSANFTSKSPDFILPNFVRDVSFGFMSESLKEGKGLRFLENTRKGMATIHRAYANKLDPKNPIDVHYQNWLKNGGPTGFVHLGSLESIKSNIDLEVKRLMKDNSLWDKTTQNRLFKKLGAMMDYAAIMSENASRFGVYLTSIEQGKSEAKAAHDGKEATVNFNTKGEWSGIIGGFFTFFNASVQGGKTFAKLAYENKNKMAIAGASFMALGYLVAAMNRFMDDDEEYDKENPYIRENNLIFKSGKNHVMIPLPHGFRMFYALGVIFNDLEHGKETPGGATRRGMSSVFSSFSPIDPVGLVDKKGSLSLRPVVPTIAIPFYDIYVKNEDFAGRKIHNEPFMLSKENVIADRSLGLKNVNPFLQDASDILFELGGGELDTGLKTKIENGKQVDIKEYYDINPSNVEHIISFYTGGRGQFFNNVIKMGNSIVDQSKEYAKDKDLKKAVDGLDINSMPILRRFYKEPWAGSNYKEFIKIRDEVEAYKATLTEYEKMMVNNVPRYIGAMTAMDLQQKAIIYESFNKSIKELNAQADNLMEYSDPSAIIEQKDQLVNQMIEQVKNIKK